MISACEVITQESGAAVSLVSHTGKANARENVFDAYAARGGSALVDNARGTIVFGRMPTDAKLQRLIIGRPAFPSERDCFILKLTRATHSPPQEPIILRPHSVLNQLVLEPAETISPAQVAEAKRRKIEIVTNGVKALVKLGIPPSVRAIRQHLNLVPGLTFREVDDAVEDAIGERFLSRGKGARGNMILSVEPNPPLGSARPNGKITESGNWEIVVPMAEWRDAN
jgi:hypothetical protein